MKKLLTLALAFVMCFGLVACGDGGNNGGGSDTPVKGGTYITSQVGEPLSMNPDTVSDDSLYAIAQNLYPRLVKLNNNYQAIPDLAKDMPEVSDDALTYTFKLHENAVWTDGEKVTSADVKYTYDEIIAKNYANAPVFAAVKSIETPDDYTVVFNMNQPDASFLANVAWYGTFIMPKHVLEGKDWLSYTDFSTVDGNVSCGPFKLDEWKTGASVTLARNDDYFLAEPYLDYAVFQFDPDNQTSYQNWVNGDVDEIASATIPTNELQSYIDDTTGDYIVVDQEWPSPYYVTFNMNEGPFADAKVRLAVAKAINREEVSQKAFSGHKPAQKYYISNVYTDAHNDEAAEPDYDPEGAEKLLKEAGLTKNANGYYIESKFRIMNSGFTDMATVIVAELEKVGIKLEIDAMDSSAWERDVWQAGNFEITCLAGFQGPDVLGSLRRWTKDGAININGYTRKEVEDLAAKALVSSSQEEINDIMKQIQVYLAEDIPVLPMVSYVDKSVFKSYIHGHPMYSNAQGGSRDKAGFSELTYTWVDNQ